MRHFLGTHRLLKTEVIGYRRRQSKKVLEMEGDLSDKTDSFAVPNTREPILASLQRQIQPALVGADVSDVSDPGLIGLGHREVLNKGILCSLSDNTIAHVRPSVGRQSSTIAPKLTLLRF